MLSYFIIGATIIIPFIGLILIARALGTDYKYQDLDEKDEPLVILGQGDYQKVTCPSDFMEELDDMEAAMEERIAREQESPLDREESFYD